MQRTNAVAIQVDERPRQSDKNSLMTAARRAGLDALEREFTELLNACREPLARPDVAA
jgi:hypothetical protein